MAEMGNEFNRMKGADHFGGTGIRDKIVLTTFLKQVWCVNSNWIQLTHDRFAW